MRHASQQRVLNSDADWIFLLRLMAKDKSQQKPPKRKKLPSCDDEVEQTKKSKRKRLKAEEAADQIPDVALAVEEEQKTKVKKRKKKQTTEQTETTKQIQISNPAEGEDNLSPEERRVLERKMKKVLKKKLKAEGLISPKAKEKESGPTSSQQALDYLTCWAHNRAAWKFQKTRQTWLLQNMFDSEQIRDEKFSVLLQYLEGLRGGSRDTTVQKALVLVQESDQAPEDGNVQKRAHRAREVIQMLSE
ncbi:protein cholesin [Festucalex cinctus]